MTIRVVLKEDRQKLGRLFDELRLVEGLPELSEFFEDIDDFFAMINRPPTHIWDKEQDAIEATRT